MNFNDDFLKRQADPNDLATIVQRQGSAIERQGQAFVRMQRIDEAAREIGEVDVTKLLFGEHPALDAIMGHVTFEDDYLELLAQRRDPVDVLIPNGFSYLRLYPGAPGATDILLDIGGASGGNIGGSFFKVANVGGVLTIFINDTPIGGVTPAIQTSSYDVFNCVNPGGVSAFAGTIASFPTSSSLTYNVTSGQEAVMVPVSTSHVGKLRLYNTTRGTSALIYNCTASTNTIQFTADRPAGWQVGDVVTIASQTVSGGGWNWIDVEIVDGALVGKTSALMYTTISSATPSDSMRLHPFDVVFSASKFLTPCIAQVANVPINSFGGLKLNSNVFSLAWSGTPSAIVVRQAGYLG